MREGAGRPAGVPSQRTIQRRAIADKAIADGVSPLEIMIANMLHFHKLAETAEAALGELSQDRLSEMEPAEQFKFLLAEVKKAAGLRELSQNCARDAAPYVHSRLSVVSGPNGSPVQIERIERVIVEGSPH